MKPDFMLYDRDHQLVLVGEVKATKNEDKSWAAKLRRNLMANRLLPEAKFFLLVLPEHTYLWKDAPAAQEVPPDYVSGTWQLIKPYLGGFGETNPRLSESGLELAVRAWLNGVADGELPSSGPAEDRLLSESGLAEQLRQGSLIYEGSA
ncbi:hypothetical protein NX773_00710 [Massilia solisilvae]|uniref:Uncharacterized protein n=1 Tax=Massilia solisilvae TaxID=1811225 RepID=A0ABT2BDT0_9BURK|nr:hypothetical protein [Massilia solisilvae]MCS0606684.1 hypothetical protein [Massilia solisilvae]